MPRITYWTNGEECRSFNAPPHLWMQNCAKDFSVRDTTSKGVVDAIKAIFSRHGIPETLVSDNGPQYSSELFVKFAAEYNFVHVTSSPHYPRSNGHAERSVQTVKNILRKSSDPLLAMLIYRSTPLPWCKLSPAELLMGRKLRTNLPILPDQLKPKWPYLKEFQMQDDRVKKNSKMNFDRQHKAQSLPQIPDDASVWITNERHQPAPGRVIEQAATPRSYIVTTEDGGQVRRNRQHLNIRPENPMTLPGQEEVTQQRQETETAEREPVQHLWAKLPPHPQYHILFHVPPMECSPPTRLCHHCLTLHRRVPSLKSQSEMWAPPSTATVQFHAYNPSGILFYQINSVITDFLGVKMHGGLPWLIFDVGSGPAVVGSNSTRTFIDGQWHTGHVVLFEQASNTFYVTVDTVHAAAITDVIVPLLTMKVYFEGFPSTRADMALQPLTACVLSPPEWYLAPDGFDAVSVQNVGSTYIIVSWDLPTHSNGILINFS
eukprot:Em0018g964a